MLFFLVGEKPCKPDFFLLIVGAGSPCPPLSESRICADYTDYADFKRISACSRAIHVPLVERKSCKLDV